MNNLLDKPNVRLSIGLASQHPGIVLLADKAECTGGREVIHNMLIDMLNELRKEKPTWHFVINKINSFDIPGVHLIGSFDIEYQGGILGTVNITARRSGYSYVNVYAISNDRIEKSYERNSDYKTQDLKRAVARIRKTFFPITPLENLAEAMKGARTQAQQLSWDAGGELESKKNSVEKLAKEFIVGVGWPLFLEYVHSDSISPAERKKILDNLTVQVELQERKDAITKIHDAVDGNECTIVIRTAHENYIVCGMGRQDYVFKTDAELDEGMRMKLGLLKLVDKGALISDVGIRVNETTFALTNEVQ